MRLVSMLGRSGPPVGLSRMRPQPDLDLHRHDHLELVVITAGTGFHHTTDGTWPLCRGDVFVIPVGLGHGYIDTDHLELINVGYAPARLAVPLARLVALPGYEALCTLEPRLRGHQAFAGHLHLTETELQPTLALIEEFDRELRGRQAGWEAATEGWLLQLLIRLARQYATLVTPAARAVLRLSKVLTHLDAHLAEPLTQEQLAMVGSLSRATLQRLFTACYGTSAIDHLNRLRVARAQHLLLTTKLPVAEIGRRVGFPDPNYFARVFRRLHGVAPTAVRMGERG